MLTLSIRGLSAVAFRKNTQLYEVLLNPGHSGMPPHVATLTVQTRFLAPFPDPTVRLDPDFIGYVPEFDGNGNIAGYRQVAMFTLTGRQVTFTTSGPPASWSNRSDTIALDEFHPGAQTIQAPGNFGVVQITQGQPSSETNFQFTVSNHRNSFRVNRLCALEVRFKGVPMVMQVAGRGAIRFRQDDNLNPPLDPVAVIANIAAEPSLLDALAHFDLYYDVVKQDHQGNDIPEGDRLTLTAQAVEVYDCVPPIAAP